MMKLKTILLVIFAILFYSFIFYLLPQYNQRYYGCSLHQEVYVQKISSKLKRKFINADEHNFPTIIYSDNGEEQSMVLGNEFGSMFEDLNVGDSIIKRKNSINYEVKPNSTKVDTIYKFYTNCKDSIGGHGKR